MYSIQIPYLHLLKQFYIFLGSNDSEMNLLINEADQATLTYTHHTTAFSSLIDGIVSAQSHSTASNAICSVRIALLYSPLSISSCQELFTEECDKWENALEKFLQVRANILFPIVYA